MIAPGCGIEGVDRGLDRLDPDGREHLDWTGHGPGQAYSDSPAAWRTSPGSPVLHTRVAIPFSS